MESPHNEIYYLLFIIIIFMGNYSIFPRQQKYTDGFNYQVLP